MVCPLAGELQAALDIHDEVFRKAFASGIPYATSSLECREANERIGRVRGKAPFQGGNHAVLAALKNNQWISNDGKGRS